MRCTAERRRKKKFDMNNRYQSHYCNANTIVVQNSADPDFFAKSISHAFVN